MPYPFMKAPTYGELIGRLQNDYGVNVKKSGINYGPRGAVRFRYLERVDHPIYILPDVADDTKRVVPSIIRGICNTLGLPLKDFGFDLG